MIDVFGKLLNEIADDAIVGAITDRVRGHHPGPGDVQGAGEFVPFVVLQDLGGPPLTRTPVQTLSVNVRAYGATPQGAKALYVACSNALHHVGPRIHSGIGIYISHDETGGTEGDDPVTHQPYVEGVFSAIVATAVVAA
jgi:hypothetical protein